MIKLGFDLNYSGAAMDLPLRDAIRAEQLGFDSVWSSETYGTDAITPLAYIAAITKKIRLATGVAQLAARPAANFAMCLQTIDAMAGGDRVIGGLGLSGPQIVEGWYGEPWGKPNARLRDYVEIVRKILKREGPVTHDGPEIQLPYAGPGSSGLGKPLKSILHGNPNIPLMLGTDKPANTRLAGEIADGWMGMHVTPDTLPDYLALLQEGIDRRADGKALKDLEIAINLGLNVTDDAKAAIDAAKPGIALYVGGMGAKGKNFHKEAMIERGYGEAAERIQELFLAGHREEAAAAVPDEFVDDGALIGPPERIRQRFATWRDSGFTLFRLSRPKEHEMELMAKLARA